MFETKKKDCNRLKPAGKLAGGGFQLGVGFWSFSYHHCYTKRFAVGECAACGGRGSGKTAKWRSTQRKIKGEKFLR